MLQNYNIDQALAWGQTTLAKTSDAPDIDSERLLLHVLKQTDTSWLYAHANEALSGIAQQEFEHAISRRQTGEPLAYILGTAEFYGREFMVTPDVLIPRPETENLIEAALEYIKKLDSPTPITIADIGTGSGCIAITLALELPESVRIIATDISPAALAVARENAKIHRVQNRIEFREGDMFSPLQGTKIDLIVSNPPYVPTQELSLPSSKETRGLVFEPRGALDGGPDGNTYVDIIAQSNIPTIIEVQNGNSITRNI